jgi:hypothetical protein
MSATSMGEYLNRLKRTVLLFACICILSSGFPAFGEQDHKMPTYEELRAAFTTPDHAIWGEVPLWWWEGETMTKERATAELEKLAAKGVKAVCPIQRSPGRSDPASFTPEWWAMFAHVNQESKRLGMTLWAYDQVGYGHYGWLEKAASRIQDPRTSRISFQTAQADAKNPVQMTLPEGKVLSARAYPVADGQADDAQSIDMTDQVSGNTLALTPKEGAWRVAVMVAEPYQSFYLSDTSADEFIDMFYGKIERTLGKASMGDSFVGIFQDEHPPTPRDIYTDELARAFKKEHGYELTRAIPAQHFDVGPLTPKYRNDYFDTYLRVVEDTYWKKIYDWTWDRGLLTSHDNWGRRDIYRQSQGYIDYFRSQRWFSAPGFDDYGTRSINQRNYYDAKIAASIARLYNRPRVWNEAFHSSGWGRTTEQTLSWLSVGMAYGANLYDEHGLYYASNASTWEHAAPDPHWRQPYWTYYQMLSDFVARSSYLMSQGQHVVDAAVHYPVVSLLSEVTPDGNKKPNYNEYMQLSQTIYNAGIDNDIIDDDSILDAKVKGGQLIAGGNGYRALVFGPERAVRRAVLEKALALVKSGGTVLFYGQLPTASTEGGRDDEKLRRVLKKLLDYNPETDIQNNFSKTFPSGGFAAYIANETQTLPRLISEHIDRDFIAEEENVHVTHREMGNAHVYLVQNAVEGKPISMKARFRVKGTPERWDPFTGEILPVDHFSYANGYTAVEQDLDGNIAEFFIFRSGDAMDHTPTASKRQVLTNKLEEDWSFSAIATRDNTWGEYRWPPSEEVIGPEVRTFKFREEGSTPGTNQGWYKPDFNDEAWATTLYSSGPYWLMLNPSTEDHGIVEAVLDAAPTIQAGASTQHLTWQEVHFSKTIGAAKAVPWSGHSGYPDGHIDKNFFQLPKGRKLLLTRIHSPKTQRFGLRVELRNKTPRLWVNGKEQPFEDAVGNLPLNAGYNTVLLDLPNGEHGRLFVQQSPPSIATMAEAARGSVKPDIDKAAWIWAGDSTSSYVRKSFTLDSLPEQARLVVSAFSGFILYVNGVMVEEEIGPWSNWKKPESFTITPYLREGNNVIAVWGQLFEGLNVNKGPAAFQSKGIVLAMKMRYADDREIGFVTDSSWKGTNEYLDHWELPEFDDTHWPTVTVAGTMGDAPWGMEVVKNIGLVTEPKRPLSIDLDSPYLVAFEEVPDITYDTKPEKGQRIGWYRFDAPPGLSVLTLNTTDRAQVWDDGIPARVEHGKARITAAPTGVSKVAIRLEMEPGAYAGAAFSKPIGLSLQGGKIRPGLWTDYALPTYSGIGVYTQSITLTADEVQQRTWLDLGQVLVAAEVRVNGKSTGTRLARPFKFELTKYLQEGDNTIEVRVANTIAPHYTTIPALHLGPTDSGLIGPVILEQQMN